MHFMNPVPVMKLVEIIPGLATGDDVLKTTVQLAKNMAKTTTVVQDIPGFVANRLLMPYINEAIMLLESASVIHLSNVWNGMWSDNCIVSRGLPVPKTSTQQWSWARIHPWARWLWLTLSVLIRVWQFRKCCMRILAIPSTDLASSCRNTSMRAGLERRVDVDFMCTNRL